MRKTSVNHPNPIYSALSLNGGGIAPGIPGGSPGPTQLPPPTDPNAIPATLFGMNIVTALPGGAATVWPTVPVGSLGKGSFMTWAYLEPANGTFDWRTLDMHTALAQSHGVPFALALEGAPGWAVADQGTCSVAFGYTRCTGMPDLTAFDAFVTALVTRYKGQIAAYELYNEPDQSFSGTVAQLVTLTQHAYTVIRSVDPAALIGTPSGGATYMDSYFAAGGVRTVDVLDFHLYPDSGQYSTPNYEAPERVKFWGDAYRIIWAKDGLTQPVWMTEGSWGGAVGSMADPDQQAAFVARWYLLHWATGVSRGFWYAWNDDTTGVLGTKAAAAYTQIAQWMVGAVMTRPISMTGASVMFDHSEPAQYACTLTRPGGYQGLAIWNTNGPTAYTPDPIFTRYRDLDGNTVSVSGAITIGYKPILLENQSY